MRDSLLADCSARRLKLFDTYEDWIFALPFAGTRNEILISKIEMARKVQYHASL